MNWKLFPGYGIMAVAFLAGCNSSDVAGTSSGVDNPQVMVAFTSSTGTPSATTGSLSIYTSDQNPALNPDPILQTRVENASSIQLSRSDFLRANDTDSTRTFNVLLIGDDSTGGILQRLTYNPKTRKFDSAGIVVSSVKLRLAPLVNYSSKLVQSSNPGGPERIFIPGTPYQAVVIDADSSFSLGKIPPGVFTAHLMTNAGVDLPLPDSLDTHNPMPQHVDSDAPPVQRPPPPPPPSNLKVDAGLDQNVFQGAETFLSGIMIGADPQDPRLAVLWKQIYPDPQTMRAQLENASALKTHVIFPKPGPYRFVLSANYSGDKTVQDTVLIFVQPPPPAAFVAPVAGDTTVFLGKSFEVVWNAQKPGNYSLQLSLNSGTTWGSPIGQPISVHAGINSIDWKPAGTASSSCSLRLSNSTDTLVSAKFVLR